jgi:hypothetical protein
MKPSLSTDTGVSQSFLKLPTSFPLHSKHVIKAIDRTLQDICSNPCPFSGITTVFGGDFQQTLPVIVKGKCEGIIDMTLQHSAL